MRIIMFIVSIFIGSQAFSGGLEPEKTNSPTPAAVNPSPATTVSAIPYAPVKAISDETDCKPKGGNTVTNQGSVTNGGDNVHTKVICQCEPKSCDPKVETKVVTKYVASKPKIIEKKVPGPTKIVKEKEVVYVDKAVPGPTVYVDKPVEKPCPACAATKEKNWNLNLMVGEGPYGVYFYRYGPEYRARVGRGILVGVDLNYRFLEHFNVGATYINNDTKMFKAGVNF